MSPAVNSTRKRAVNRNALAHKPILRGYTHSSAAPVVKQSMPFEDREVFGEFALLYGLFYPL